MATLKRLSQSTKIDFTNTLLEQNRCGLAPENRPLMLH